MRVAVAADLHVGVTPEEAAHKLVDSIRQEDASMVILAGDLGEPLHRFEKALSLFRDVGTHVAVLAGNHDVWHRTGPHSSRGLWEHLLAEAVARHGFIWLEDEIVVRDDVAIVGTLAWYDYSSRAPGYEDKSNKAFFRTKGAYNNDGNFIDWPWTDIEFADAVGNPFLQRLATACSRPGVAHVIVVTHVPVFREQKVTVQKWNTGGDAYYGNWTLGRRIESFEKVRMVVSGHTHLGVVAKHLTPDGRAIPAVTIGSEYGKPAYYVIDTDLFV
jgi:3',5'-cyclic AMP phosphodiesterase CpdA